jgi:hypothetical protein
MPEHRSKNRRVELELRRDIELALLTIALRQSPVPASSGVAVVSAPEARQRRPSFTSAELRPR